MSSIYLDHNATTPLSPKAAAAMADCQAKLCGNPSSQHRFGRQARQWLENAREGIASLLGAHLDGCPPDRVVFTSGGTEANNLAILGLAGKVPSHLVSSPIEHPSVARPVEALAQRGWHVESMTVDSDGQVIVDSLPEIRPGHTCLVSLMLANNETGVLQPVDELADQCQRFRVPLHTDAVQAAGKIAIDFRGLGVSTLSVSAHKFHGPAGIGALIVRHDINLAPVFLGGFQQEGLRPGTESPVLAVGMHVALDELHAQLAEESRRLSALRNRFEHMLASAAPVRIHGGGAARLAHTSCVAFPGVSGEALVMALDLAGVACSTGSACASGASEPSPALLAMGVPTDLARSSLRISFGRFTSDAEMLRAAHVILSVYKDLRQPSSPGKTSAPSRIEPPISL